MSNDETIQPLSATLGVPRAAKEARLGQRGRVIWLFGLSGAGKSTLASGLELRLAAAGRHTALLDGDNLRAGINRGLGFTDEDRTENLRRAAEVARLFVQTGAVVICAFITPLRAQRRMLGEIIGPEDLVMVHVSATFATCAKRDPKGLYAKAARGAVKHFTGKDSGFESPAPGEHAAVIDSENNSVETALGRLEALVRPRLVLA